MRQIFGVAVALALTVSPGCHVLGKLGEPPLDDASTEPASREEIRQGQSVPPESSPKSFRAPEPGLDDKTDTPSPPLPGLNDDTDTPERPQPGLIPDEKNERSSRPSRRDIYDLRGRINGNTGINTNTAIAPGEGQFVYRTQLRFLQSHSSPAPADIDVNLLVNSHVLAYGVRENLSLFGEVPLVKRGGTVRPPMPTGAFTETEDFGVGDMRFFAKYRFWEEDEPGETTRWSVFGGLEVPSYDKNFSSDSWDPFLGTVWTYQSLEWGLDLDWFWNFNTGRGIFRHDEMRYDAAYTYVLLTGQTLDEKFWQLNSIFEVNGSYLTEGSHLVFLAPGFQLAMERMIVEASLQLPVIRDLKNGIEPDFVFVIGTRMTW